MIMFDGLKVAKNNKMLCEKWMNQCPVIFLSFKDVDGRTFENVFELLKFTIAQFCDAHAWILYGDSRNMSLPDCLLAI